MNYTLLLDHLTQVHQRTHRAAVTAVSQAATWRNWLIGAWIFEYEQAGSDRAAYGERLLERISTDLTARGVTGCSLTALKLARQVALAYPELAPQIGQTVSDPSSLSIGQTLSDQSKAIASQGPACFPALRSRLPTSDLPWRDPGFVTQLAQGLSWSHLIELARLELPLKRAFYEVQTLKEGWGVRELRRQIDSMLFERVGLSKDQGQVMAWARSGVLPETPQAIMRDPVILEFTGLQVQGSWSESDLEQALIDHLHDFLLELGKGFCFVGRQYRITIANKHHHLDLLFYHRHLRCLVAIDLKIGAFDHADAGQMNLYLNWLREKETRPDENPPVGIVLCAGKDEEEVHYATTGLDQQMFVSRYLVELPSEERLRAWLHQEQEVLARLAVKGRTP